MPRLAAEVALRTANVPPFYEWTVRGAAGFCRHNGVKAVDNIKFYRLMGAQQRPRWDLETWDAKTFEYPDERRLIVYRDQRYESRMVWSIVHELGHLLLGHQGALLNLETMELEQGERWHEDEANLFARHVLLPADEMREFFHSRKMGIAAIAAAKGISKAAVQVRLKTMLKDGALA